MYTPPGFAITGERYPLLVLFDGEDNLNTVPVPVILDNLIAKKRIPPMVAILIEAPGFSRFADLACSARFTEFLTREAVPWMRDNYHATASAARTFVAGRSLGGLGSRLRSAASSRDLWQRSFAVWVVLVGTQRPPRARMAGPTVRCLAKASRAVLS